MEIVSFEIAKKLKEKGFPQKYMGGYDMIGPTYIDDGRFYENGCITEVARAYSAPTISQVLKWLREEKNIFVVTFMADDSNTPLTYEIYMGTECLLTHHGEYFTLQEWNECNLSGIKYCLDNLI